MDSGYHCGLRTGESDLPSRILAVADVYDALTQNRPYREALSKDRALEILTREQRTVLFLYNVRGRARRTCRGGRPLERFSEGQSFENRRAVRLRHQLSAKVRAEEICGEVRRSANALGDR